MTSRAPSDLVCVAAVATAHGVWGAFRLRCFTEQPEDAAAFGPVFDRDGRELFSLTVVAHAKGGLIVSTPGITDRDQALALRGLELFVPRARLPEPAEEEFYVADLEGLAVERADGTPLGEVRRVDNYGAGDVIEIRTGDGRLLDLPFDRATVPVVDLAGRRLVVEVPAGLPGGDAR
jgi:16S rRNA processing protein RimM